MKNTLFNKFRIRFNIYRQYEYALNTREGSINDYLSDKILSVFSEVYTMDARNPANRELFASNSGKMTESFENDQRTARKFLIFKKFT